jgi:Holliday junction resolvasome RuvABC endonuclease subunit
MEIKYNTISIDSSLNGTGLYLHDKSGGSESLTIKPKGDRKKKMLTINESISNAIDVYDIELMIIEDYAFNVKKTRSFTILAEVQGIIKMHAYRRDIIVLEVPIFCWKTFFSNLPKKENKKEYAKFISRRAKKEFKTTDEADAYLLFQTVKNVSKGMIWSEGHKNLIKKINEIGGIWDVSTSNL